ncbi:MAG: transporter ATP-binding protein, partial [Thermoleophilia bacterium]|nr:transporter ATP-binding protein [Thermoleophilia bacterium]
MTDEQIKDEKNGGWKSFKRLLSFWGPFKWDVFWSALFAIGVALIGMLIPRQIGKATDHLTQRNFDAIHGDVWMLLAAAFAMAVIGASRRIVAGRMSLGLEQTLRETLFTHLTGLGYRFFDRQQTGQLLSRVTSDVSQVRFFLGYGLTYMFMHAAKIIAIPIYLWVIEPRLAAIVFVMMPIMLLVSVRYSRRSHPIMRESQQKLALVTAHGEETIVGARVVRSFGQEDREVERFRLLTQEVVEQERRTMLVKSRFQPLYGLIPNLTLAVVVLVAASLIDSGRITVGAFVTFFFLVFQLTSPLRIIGNLLSRAQRATASGVRLWEILDNDVRLPVREDPLPVPTGQGGGSELRFEGVSFGYRDGRRVLDDVTLTIPAGQTVALLGPTGCGKTTLASMIPRFYDPDEGSITIDGVDLRDLDLQELRRSIGLVDQEPYLFSATVAENLRYGNPDATIEDVWRAIDAAQARGFVEALPDGIDTVVGERGLTLSGGQRQRLAIARALVVDPNVLILDDATASVDSQVESRISDSLASASRQRTTIII